MAEKDDYLVDMIVSLGFVKSSEMELARRVAQTEKKGTVDVLLEVKAIKPVDVTQAKAAHFGVQIADLEKMEIPSTVINRIPRHLAQKFRIIPIRCEGNVLTIAFEDPSDLDTIDSLNHLLRMEIVHMIATEAGVDAALKKYYSDPPAAEAGANEAGLCLQPA